MCRSYEAQSSYIVPLVFDVDVVRVFLVRCFFILVLLPVPEPLRMVGVLPEPVVLPDIVPEPDVVPAVEAPEVVMPEVVMPDVELPEVVP